MNLSFDVKYNIVLCFYLACEMTNARLIDVYYKMGNYNYILNLFENIVRENGVEAILINSIFYNKNPLYPEMKCIKEIIDQRREHLDKTITPEDVEIIIKFKDSNICAIREKNTIYENFITNLGNKVKMLEENMEVLKKELQNKNFHISCLRKDVYFDPLMSSPSLSSPPGLSLQFPQVLSNSGSFPIQSSKPIELSTHAEKITPTEFLSPTESNVNPYFVSEKLNFFKSKYSDENSKYSDENLKYSDENLKYSHLNIYKGNIW